MSTLFSFLIFILVLVLYIHITAHYKKSEDLEIYETDYSTNSELQEICELRQPILFDLKASGIPSDVFDGRDLASIESKSEKSSLEVHVKDCTDPPEIAGESILLPFRSAYGLISTDSKSRFFSENNTELVADILEPQMRDLDEYLKPGFTIQTKYDIIFGADKSHTTCRYHQDYRKFFLVKNGKIQVKMTPWKSRRYLWPENDYTNYEFRSPVDIWTNDGGSGGKYSRDMENMKFLEFEVLEGFVLYVPPFWFYSIRFIGGGSGGEGSQPTMLESYTYNSLMNIVSNLPNWGMYFLQQYNTTTKVLPHKTLEDSSKEVEKEENQESVISSKKDELADFMIV